MNILRLHVHRLPALSSGTIIDPVTLAKAEQINRQLRSMAAQRLRRWRSVMAIRRARAETALQQQRVAFEAEMHERKTQLEQEVIADALGWTVAEMQFEATVADRITQQVAQCAVQAFMEFSANEARAPLLLARVQQLIKELPSQQRPVLSVHGEHMTALTQQLDAELCRVQADDSLSPSCAMLDTELLRIVIDLDRQRDLLAEHLGAPATLAMKETME